VSDFVTLTCRFSPRPHVAKFAAWCCSTWAGGHGVTNGVGEFSVETMLPCSCTADVTLCHNAFVAVPRGCSVYRQLPRYFADDVDLFETVANECAQCVELLHVGRLHKCSSTLGFYEFQPTSSPTSSSVPTSPLSSSESWRTIFEGNLKILGEDDDRPTVEQLVPLLNIGEWSVNVLPSIRCLAWPLQAADWPARTRRYNWSNAASIDLTVANGCDLVQPTIQQITRAVGEKDGMLLGRLSFARAETVLLGSWSPTQQLLYILLRFLLKTSRMKYEPVSGIDGRCADFEIRCLKATLLWCYENDDPLRWTGNNLLTNCYYLLRNLYDSLVATKLADYFTPEWNLLECDGDQETIENACQRLETFADAERLADWFMQNYVRPCVSLCSDHVQTLVNGFNSDARMAEGQLAATVQWRRDGILEQSFRDTVAVMSNIGRVVNGQILERVEFWQLKRAFIDIDDRLIPYVVLATCCQLAFDCRLYDEITDYVVTCLEQVLNCFPSSDALRRRSTNDRPCAIAIEKALHIMRCSQSTSHSLNVADTQRVLAQFYLKKSLDCSSCPFENLQCIANVYLAAFYYARTMYDSAVDHCMIVLTMTSQEDSSRHVIEGQLLPKLDDDVDNVMGLVTLYQFLLSSAFRRRQHQEPFVCCLTPILFAHYLLVNGHALYGDMPQRHIESTTQQYVNQLMVARFLTCADVLLCYLRYTKTLWVRQAENFIRVIQQVQEPEDETETYIRYDPFTGEDLFQRLIVVIDEYWMEYNQNMSRDYINVCRIVTTDMKAMLHHRMCTRKAREEGLELNAENVDILWPEMAAIQFPVVISLPFTVLMEDDIASMVALRDIVISSGDAFGNKNIGVSVSQLTLSLYVLMQGRFNLKQSASLIVDDMRRVKTLFDRLDEDKHDRMLLSFIYRKAMNYLTNSITEMNP
jgi:hypothetical protein